MVLLEYDCMTQSAMCDFSYDSRFYTLSVILAAAAAVGIARTFQLRSPC
jgi:hypothetical protein